MITHNHHGCQICNIRWYRATADPKVILRKFKTAKITGREKNGDGRSGDR